MNYINMWEFLRTREGFNEKRELQASASRSVFENPQMLILL